MVKAKNCRKAFSDKAKDSESEDPNMPIFFYMPDAKPYGVFCQWFPAEFTFPIDSLVYLKRPDIAPQELDTHLDTFWTNLPSTSKTEPEGNKLLKFNCTEKYHMFAKSLYFSAFTTASLVMAARDPKTQKLLTKQVSGYVREEWYAIGPQVAETANYAKFSQISRLKTALLRTGDRQLCEAASKDTVRGIGLNEKCCYHNLEGREDG